MPMIDVWTAWDWELNCTIDEIFVDEQAAIAWCDKQNAGIDIDEGEPGFSPHILSRKQEKECHNKKKIEKSYHDWRLFWRLFLILYLWATTHTFATLLQTCLMQTLHGT